MEEELNLFFGFLENDKKVSNNTLQSYERDLKQYERYLSEQGKEYKEETNEGIKEYITYMQEIGKKSSTISRGLASIRSFYQYGVKNKDVENDPTEGISSPKIEKRVPSVLTSSEVALLLDQPKNVDLKAVATITEYEGKPVDVLADIVLFFENIYHITLVLPGDIEDTPFSKSIYDDVLAVLRG